MTTMQKTLTTALIAAAAVSAAYAGSGYVPTVQDDQRYGGYLYHIHHAGMGYKADAKMQGMHFGSDIHHLDMLELSEAQQGQIDTITSEFNDEMARLQSKRDQVAAELPTLYAAEVPDAEAIGNAYGVLFEAKRERIEVMIDTRNRVFEVLTDEQREELGRFNNGPSEEQVQS